MGDTEQNTEKAKGAETNQPTSVLRKSDLDKKSSSMHVKTGEPGSERNSLETGGLDTVIEVNEAVASEVFEILEEWGEYVEDPPKIFSIKDVAEPLTIESLNNAIYELGVVNMCWPEIKDPVFETRTCFPPSYYTNSNKERLLLAYAECFRRQFHLRFKKNTCYRKPLLLQAPNACGLQKMVCTTIRATKLCFNGTNTWEGLASLIADYFVYEPLTQPMLHPKRILSPYTALIRRAGNAFEIAHVLVSWLIGATYDAYVVVGCADRDTCLNIRYRTDCPEVPDENPVIEKEPEPEEEPRYKLVPLPDYTSKYVKLMEYREQVKIQDELDRLEAERQLKIKEIEKPPPDPIDGWRTHAWVIIMPGPMGVKEPFFIEPVEGNAYPLDSKKFQQIDAIYNNENYYVNLQTLMPIEEEEWSEDELFEEELRKAKEKIEKETGRKMKEEDELKRRQEREKQRKIQKAAEAEAKRIKDEEEQKAEKLKEKEDKTKKEDKEHQDANKELEELKRLGKERKEAKEKEAEEKKKKKKKKKKVEEVVEEEEVKEEEPKPVVMQDLSYLKYDLSDLKCWEHLLPGEPFSRRVLVGVDYRDKRSAVDTEKHLDIPDSWVEKLDITSADFEQRYPGCHKEVHYKRVIVEKFSRYSQTTGIVKRIKIFQDYALTIPLLTHEYYSNRDDKMEKVRIDHKKQEVVETFEQGRVDHLLKHTYLLDAPPLSVEGHRTMEFKWYARIDQLERIVCTPLTLEEFYAERHDKLESRHMVYGEGTKEAPKRKLLKVTEIYSRNPDKPAKNDIWKRIFNIEEGTINLLYHYAYSFVTNDTRQYIKPNLAETGGKILFYPDKTSGYISCPCAPQPRPLDIYMTLCENIEWEERTTKHIREYETDFNNYLIQRYKELTEPSLYVSLFNTERNEEAQRAYLEMQRMLAEMAARETEEDIDPLQPYLARMFGETRGLKPLSVKEATIVRDQCINDFKATQLARQMLVQERFDKMNDEYKAKRLWYLANQFILTPEKEAAYFALSAELSFKVHSLEVRLTRHKDLSGPRYRLVEAYLNRHPLLTEYNRMKAYYRQNK